MADIDQQKEDYEQIGHLAPCSIGCLRVTIGKQQVSGNMKLRLSIATDTSSTPYSEAVSMRLLIAALAVLTLSSNTLSSLSLSAADKPNIVVFLVDDMGVMDTSVAFLTDKNGTPKRYPLNDYYRTPSMERLAKQGVRFNNFYAMSVCSPTRNSIMTGQNAARHHATNWINPWQNNKGPYGPPNWDWEGLDATDITLPGTLRKNGYKTIHVGKAHFGPEEHAGSEPLNLGFDVNVAGRSVGAPGSYYGEKNYGNPKSKNKVPGLDKYHGTETFLTEALTIEAKRHLTETVRADKPFYLYMSHYAVHAPFNSDPRFANHYKDSGKSKNAQAFATLIEGMDKSLGDILDHLDELGVAENTLVIFLGDNGSDAPLGHQHEVACAAPLRGKKGAHYEGGMRVPFIAAWAQPNSKNIHQQKLPIPANVIQPQQAAVMDLFPTILNLTDVKIPNGHKVDGRLLDTLLTGKPDSSRSEEFLMNYPHAPHRSDYFTVYRNGDWKVVYHFYPSKQSDGSHYQLYNLKNDPFESTNLAEKEPAQLRTMMKKLVASMEAHDGQYPVSKENPSQPLKPMIP
ncbi:MAG: sulfatase [Planctomycetaceae bacterium]|nr:sulfatase [Planctomycetaceae bacterium]MDG2387743.1 sulfatase [Planctomycetaceae bacterium]